MKQPLRFWSFSPRVSTKQWDINAADEKWGWRAQWWLRDGRRVASKQWPLATPLFGYSELPVQFTDMPRSGDFYIASARLREFFEAEAPGAAQYLPIRIDGPGSASIPGPYWAMNFVRVFDCLDEELSMNTDENGDRFVEVPVIDPRRIPDDGVLGLLGGYQVIRLIRNDLRLKIKKAGFTGLDFFGIAHSTTPEDVTWEKPDHRAEAEVAKRKHRAAPAPAAAPKPRKRRTR